MYRMGGLRYSWEKPGTQPAPHNVCVCAAGAKEIRHPHCKCERGLPDGRHPERHKERAKRNGIVRGSKHTGSVHRWKLADHSPGASSRENADKVRLQFPRLLCVTEKSGWGSESISSSKVAQIWRTWQAWARLSCSWCGAHRRDAGRQTHLQCSCGSLALGLIRDWIIL